jgi:flagellar hook-associated protein 2
VNINAKPEDSFTVTVGSGVNTLSDVASYINSQNKGVTASVITDATGARLSIVSTATGTARDFTISDVSLTDGSPFMKFNQVAAKDASINVDGIPITSSTNTITGVLSGVTLNLNSAPVDGSTKTVTMTVAPNSSSMASAINNFVSHYNTLLSGISNQFMYDTGSESAGALSGDTTIRNLQSDLFNAATYTSSSSGSIKSLSDLGISMKDDGTLTVDSAKLNSALTNNKSDVLKFFQGTSSNGFANTLEEQMNLYSSSTDGAFTVEIKNNKSQISDLQHHIDDIETYVTEQQKVWTQKYSEAAAALQSVQTKIDQINAMLDNKD